MTPQEVQRALQLYFPPDLAQRYVPIRLIGEGAMGTVFQVQELDNPQQIWAIKIIRLNNDPQFGLNEDMVHELSALTRLSHPNIIRIKEVEYWENTAANPSTRDPTTNLVESRLGIVEEYADSDLHQVIQSWFVPPGKRERKDVQIPMQLKFAHEILCGLRYLHANQIWHMDLKPANILIHDGHVKIADFGLAERADGFKGLGEYRVTWAYRSPELQCNFSRYNGAASDLWSVGVILCEMLFDNDLFWKSGGPFPGTESNLFRNITAKIAVPSRDWFTMYSPDTYQNTNRCPVPAAYVTDTIQPFDLPSSILSADQQEYYRLVYYGETLYKEIWNLITQCLHIDPNNRITAEEAAQHPLFTQFCGTNCLACAEFTTFHIARRTSDSDYTLSINWRQNLNKIDSSGVLTLYADEIFRRVVKRLGRQSIEQSGFLGKDLYQMASASLAMKMLNFPQISHYRRVFANTLEALHKRNAASKATTFSTQSSMQPIFPSSTQSHQPIFQSSTQSMQPIFQSSTQYSSNDSNQWSYAALNEMENLVANLLGWNFDGPETNVSDLSISML